MSSNSTPESSNATLDYFTNLAQTIAVNFTPVFWLEKASKLFCDICNSEDPKVRAASGALNLAIIGFIVIIAAKAALWFWKFYKFYIQYQYISAGANAYESKYKGSWVVITGSTNGIGLAFAKKFAEKKAKIVLVSRSQQKLDACKEELEKLGAEKVDTIQCDFSDIQNGKNIDDDSVVAKLRSDLDLDNRKVGILINNVGIMDNFNLFHRYSLSSLLKVMDVNFKSAVVMSWLVAPQMAKRKFGLFVNISSMISFSKSNYFGLYRESKLAMDGLSEKLSFEYQELSVLLLHTGPCRTNIFYRNKNDQVPDWVALPADTYAASAYNIIQAAATNPGLTETSGHILFELATWFMLLGEVLGIQRKVLAFFNVVPEENESSSAPAASQSGQTANKDVAETNIDIPLNG